MTKQSGALPLVRASCFGVDKNRPSREWIEALRARFPTEREIDRVLTRKMERRAGAGFSPLSLEQLVAGVGSLIRAAQVSRFEIRNAKWLSGGASKLQVSFDLDWERPGHGRDVTAMVLRMEPAESIVETSRQREFELIRAFEGIVPVPPVFWVDGEGSHLPYPALVYGFAPGVTKPSASTYRVSGLGTNLGVEWRARLAPQFIDYLARIHTRDLDSAPLPSFERPRLGTQSVEWGINWWERVWEEDAGEDIPLMRLAAAWMRANMPAVDRLSIVHADYRVGNFLFNEDDGRITALLDWELGRIGDRHQDLAWTTSRAFSHFAEDGKTLLVTGLLPEAEFFDRYQAASGLSVNRKTLHFYKVYNAYMLVVLTIATGYRAARNGKTHQDILLTWLLGIGSMLSDELRNLIEEAA